MVRHATERDPCGDMVGKFFWNRRDSDSELYPIALRADGVTELHELL